MEKAEKSRLSIIIPAYNEAEALTHTLPEVMAYAKQRNWKVICVNDGSKDRTKEILAQYSDNICLKAVHHKVNRGYGGALKSGIRNADTEYLVTIDADGQHYLEDIDKLMDLITAEDADMVVGSRKGLASATKIRGLGKWLIRMIAKVLMPIEIYDINSGMKIYRTELVKNYIHLCPNSMAFSDIITLVFINNRHLVLEIPIRIKQRLAGESTIGAKTAFQTVAEIVNIIVMFNPMKIFLPVSVLFVLLGLIWGVPIMVQGRGVSVGMSLLLTMGVFSFLLGLIAEQLSEIRKHM